jgi:hypothetical protein
MQCNEIIRDAVQIISPYLVIQAISIVQVLVPESRFASGSILIYNTCAILKWTMKHGNRYERFDIWFPFYLLRNRRDVRLGKLNAHQAVSKHLSSAYYKTSEYQAHQRLFEPSNPRKPCVPRLSTCTPVLKVGESQVSNVIINYYFF